MELTQEYLDKKFNAIDDKFSAIDSKFESLAATMATKQEMESLREEMAKEETISKLYTAIDAYMKETRAFNDEKKVLQNNQERTDKWIEKAAKKLDIKFEV